MTERNLHLAAGLSLPAEQFIESKSAILGASGGGKSGALKVLQEELVKCRLPFITFDPAGIAWGIRSSIDGKGPGMEVMIVGGEHADVALDMNAGAEWAREVVGANCQVIFDISDESNAATQRFMAAFFDELYRAQGRSKTPRLVIIDEAHEVLPQDVQKSDAASFGAVKRIVTRGRNRGLGVCLVSQRPAGIAKSVLTQCGSLFIFGVLGTPDRKAIGEWVGAWGAQDLIDKFDEGIAALKQQECWFWSPREFQRFEKVKIRNFTTFHPDYTHLRKMGLLQVQPVTAAVDELITRLSKEMEKVRTQKAEAADLPKLRQQVKELEARLVAARAAGPARVVEKAVADPKAVERAVRETEGRYRAMLLDYGKRTNRAARLAAELSKSLEDMPTALSVAQTPITVDVVPSLRRQETQIRYADIPEPKSPNDGETKLLAGERRMLEAISRASLNGDALSRAQVGTLAGMSYTSGSFSNYIGHLKALGLVSETIGGLRATYEGQEKVGPVDPAPTNPEQLREMWKAKLLAGERRMLDALVEAGEAGLTRPELAERSGMTGSSGSFSNYVGTLKRNAIAIEDQGVLRAAPELR